MFVIIMFVVLDYAYVRFRWGNRQRNDFYLPGCPVWMFITVYDVIYLGCLISNK